MSEEELQALRGEVIYLTVRGEASPEIDLHLSMLFR